MARLQEAIKNKLANDTALKALLTGGIFYGDDLDASGFSADDVPRQADGVRIKPVGVLRFKGMGAYGPRGVKAERGSVEVHCYADWGFTVIDPAITRIKALLNRHFEWGTDNRSLAHFVITHIGEEMRSDDFGGSSTQYIRFQLTQTRK